MVEGEASSADGLRLRKEGENTTTGSEYRREGKMKVNAGVSGSAADASGSAQEPSVSERTASGNAATEGAFTGPDGSYRGFMPMPFPDNWPMNNMALGPGFDFGSLGPPPLVPVLLPGPFPSFYQAPGHDQHPHQGGVFAVPIMPMFGPMGGVPQGGFIPLSFNMPPAAPPSLADGHGPSTSAAGEAEAGRAGQGDGREAGAPDGLRQRQGGRAVGAGGRADNPRVVRRFRVGFQVDLLLILKLAVVVFVFNQDSSKDRLMLLLLLAGIVYLYQTGALAPILRWISQSAQRAMMPPQQPLPVPEGGQNREVGGAPPEGGEARAGIGAGENREAVPPGGPGQEGAVRQGEGGPAAVGADGAPQPVQNPNWWGFFKEVQMIVVGFLTSLLPGFQHVD
ncbi:hypothetical protein R1sor_001308 [Riccia sorocarpa]|uniref:Uncharacterized protein n=1 Tax=Riccia sorocarpa TaxID=122646 RepID=A0ABD3GX83_9MARC